VTIERSGARWAILTIPVSVALISLSTTLLAQGCPASTTPSLNGQAWKDNGRKSVYVDPGLPAAMQTSIRQAAADFSSQTGQPINVLPAGSSDPGSSTQDAIRILNNASGSPTSFAHTSTVVVTQNGVSTNQQVSAQISFNTGANLAPASGGNPAVPYYDPNQPNAAQYVYDTTMHELGHAYGLNDAPVPPDPITGQPDYALQSAGASIMNGSVNTNDQGPHVNSAGQTVAGGVGAKSVQGCDRQQISTANPPPSSPPPPPPTCNQGGSPGTCEACTPPACTGLNVWNPALCACTYPPTSPIVIDTDGHGFHLTSAEGGVRFDFYGSGTKVQISWTAEGSTNGWLALDRNGNGTIDNGGELFGNLTAQPASSDPNGFLALGVFDLSENGGNGDGVIDRRDSVWPRLLVWIDANHDGISQPEELHSLDDIGIRSIGLQYRRTPFVDAYGNEFRYRGRLMTDPEDPVARVIYDVILTTEPNTQFDLANLHSRHSILQLR
jgi:hypothetical protein